MSKAAELIVKCLENEGVAVVFGLPGEENIRFVQALASSNIRYVLTRHEDVEGARALLGRHGLRAWEIGSVEERALPATGGGQRPEHTEAEAAGVAEPDVVFRA